jgi:hypothetical protein
MPVQEVRNMISDFFSMIFGLIGDVIGLVFDVVFGAVGLVFGLLGGIVSLTLSLGGIALYCLRAGCFSSAVCGLYALACRARGRRPGLKRMLAIAYLAALVQITVKPAFS